MDKLKAAEQKRNIRRIKRHFQDQRAKKYYHPLNKIKQ